MLAVGYEQGYYCLMNWETFVSRFKDELGKKSPEELDQAWNSAGERTKFYRTILERIAHAEKLEYYSERLLVDHVFCKPDEAHQENPTPVPVVWVESENVVPTAHHEIWKLCSLAAPLKVLITVGAWNSSLEWGGAGKGAGFPQGWQTPDQLLELWQKQLDVFSAEGHFYGQLGILIGERPPGRMDAHLPIRFYALELKPGAKSSSASAVRII